MGQAQTRTVNGTVYIINLTGNPLTLTEFTFTDKNWINNNDQPYLQSVESGNVFLYSHVLKLTDFSHPMILNYQQGSYNYTINLSGTNWFGSSSIYHYPDQNSDLRLLLVGTDDSGSNASIMLQYREVGNTEWNFSTDSSKVLSQSSINNN